MPSINQWSKKTEAKAVSISCTLLFLATILFCTSPNTIQMLSFCELPAAKWQKRPFFLSQSPICSNPQSSKVDALSLFCFHLLSVSLFRLVRTDQSKASGNNTRFFYSFFPARARSCPLNTNRVRSQNWKDCIIRFFTISLAPFLETMFFYIFTIGFFLLFFISHFVKVWPLHDCPQTMVYKFRKMEIDKR